MNFEYKDFVSKKRYRKDQSFLKGQNLSETQVTLVQEHIYKQLGKNTSKQIMLNATFMIVFHIYLRFIHDHLANLF